MWLQNAVADCLDRHVSRLGQDQEHVLKDSVKRFLMEAYEEKSYDLTDHYGGIRSNSNGRKYNRRKHQPSDRIH